MATKRKKKTKNQIEYQKQRRRLQNAVYRGRKQGYEYPEDIIPKMPKRVTKKALENIKAIKPLDLLKRANFVDTQTGEVIPALQHKEKVRKAKKQLRAVRKKQQKKITGGYIPTFSVIDVVYKRIEELTRKVSPPFPITERKNALLRIFEDTITLYSDNIGVLEQYLLKNEEIIAEHLNIIQHESDAEKIQVSFAQLARLLNVGGLTESQAIEVSESADYYNG